MVVVVVCGGLCSFLVVTCFRDYETDLITLFFDDSLDLKTDGRNTAVLQSCFSFSLLPPWSVKIKNI